MLNSFLLIFIPSVLILLYAGFLTSKISKLNCGNANMQSIAQKISDGASNFLRTLHKYLVVFIFICAIIFMILTFNKSYGTYLSKYSFIFFIFGAFLSALSGWIGMKIATKANVRTTQAATSDLKSAFNVALTGGSVMGMAVCGLSLLGLSLIFLCNFVVAPIFYRKYLFENVIFVCPFLGNCIMFAFGAECVALFCRIAGGIFTKAADVGADLVGKIEKDIPEDDPRNPAVIADNVGDNVGDVAGMGADLFGSFTSVIVATMFLCKYLENCMEIFLPMSICLFGIIISVVIIKILTVIKSQNVQILLKRGIISAVIVNTIVFFVLCKTLLPYWVCINNYYYTNTELFMTIFIGLMMSLLINYVTRYYTSNKFKPVKFIIQQSKSGHATNVIAGLCMGMESLVLPTLMIVGGVVLSYKIAYVYGIAFMAVGFISLTMMQLSIDAFGAIADNAGGIAEMSGLDENVRKNTDILDTIGNTTAATGKSFTLVSASLTFCALLVIIQNHLKISNSTNSIFILCGLLLGGVLPFLVSSISIKSVGSAAMIIVNEVRRQFKEIVGLSEGKVEPDYGKCINISTKAAIKGMFLPGLLTLTTPIFIYLLGGVQLCIWSLYGVFVSSILLGFLQSNAGGAWDNAKKSFEKGVDIDGETFYKKSEPHKSAVTGDTIGDPLKDTSGPAMNIVMKLVIFVVLILTLVKDNSVFPQIKVEKIVTFKCHPGHSLIKKNMFLNDLAKKYLMECQNPINYYKEDENGNYEKYYKDNNICRYEKYYHEEF